MDQAVTQDPTIADVYTGEFFQVLEGEYQGTFMLYLADRDLPEAVRAWAEVDRLFYVVHVNMLRGTSIVVVVEEVPEEIEDLGESTPVQIRSPLVGFTFFPNGAKIVLRHDGEVTPEFQPVLLARFNEEGEIVPHSSID